MFGSEQSSREELLAVIESQARVIEELTARVAELERRLGRNSGNPSRPPSADGPAAPPSRATRRRSDRNPGKQPGAGGSALFQTSDPDEIVDHVPDACGGCGGDLAYANPAGMARRQVRDIPTITPTVIEHRLHKRPRRPRVGHVRSGAGWTHLVLGPDRSARAVDGLVTGWHEPTASHLLLLEAVAGPRLVGRAYSAAVDRGYLWHEFGDSCLLLASRTAYRPV